MSPITTIRYLDVLPLRRYNAKMNISHKRATIYFDPDLHRALRFKSAETDRSISDIVNEAVSLRFTEDAQDLAAFEERANEPNLSFEDVLKDLKGRAKI